MALDASLQNAGRVPADAATRRRRAARPFFFDERGTDPDAADNNWPKTVVYLAGWGFGHGTLNGKPRYENYEMHFMVTQEIRDRKTLRVNYPMANKRSPAGEVNPAILEDDQRHQGRGQSLSALVRSRVGSSRGFSGTCHSTRAGQSR